MSSEVVLTELDTYLIKEAANKTGTYWDYGIKRNTHVRWNGNVL